MTRKAVVWPCMSCVVGRGGGDSTGEEEVGSEETNASRPTKTSGTANPTAATSPVARSRVPYQVSWSGCSGGSAAV